MKKIIIAALLSFPVFLSATVYKTEPKNFKPKFEVAGAFLEHDGKLLFLHRQDAATQGNTWGIPGGKVEKGETPKQAIIREVQEETGIDISHENIQSVDKVYIRYPDYDYVFDILKTEVTKKPDAIKLSFREHKGYTWVTTQDALKMPLMPDEDTLIKDYYHV